MKTTVALVDDHELLRSGLAAIINSFGEFEVVLEAGNGLEKSKSNYTARYCFIRHYNARNGWL